MSSYRTLTLPRFPAEARVRRSAPERFRMRKDHKPERDSLRAAAQRDPLPDGGYPVARVSRLYATRPRFLSNRDGWRAYYRWQRRHGLLLQRSIDLDVFGGLGS